MGLCFSVPEGVRQPPSLQNIFRELHDDIGMPLPSTGDLTPWARQGVLLLNAVLTVSPRSAGSHAGKGWERFTDRAVAELSARREGVVFLLWGKYAQQKGAIVDRTRHHVLTAAHPSPYSASGFFGCRHFSRTNALLEENGGRPIDWRLAGSGL
jgi:uracil-DNA glycosylase